MEFKFNDGGRTEAGFKGHAGDCVVRAVTIATKQPYLNVYKELGDGCRSQKLTKRSSRKASARNGVNVKRKWFKDYMAALGWIWTPTMFIGSGCKVHLTDGELPDGRLIVSVSKHYTTVINGVVHDTHDPQRDAHCCRRFPGWETYELKPNETRNINGIHTIQRRCVYGYWKAIRSNTTGRKEWN
jgi:hypothetical protein